MGALDALSSNFIPSNKKTNAAMVGLSCGHCTKSYRFPLSLSLVSRDELCTLQVMSACPGKYVCYSRQCLQSPSSPREVCSQQLHQPTPCPLLLAPHTSKEGTLKPLDLSTQASADTEASNRKRSMAGLQRTGGGVRQAARMGFF